MGQSASTERAAADRELVEKAETSSLLRDTGDGRISQSSSPVASPERREPAVPRAWPKPEEVQEEASSSAAATVRTVAAVASWMALNITIGNLNGWILKYHAFSYPVRTPHSLALHAHAGGSHHPLATIAPLPHHTCHAHRTPAPAVHLTLTLTLTLTLAVHAHLAPSGLCPHPASPRAPPWVRRSCSRPYT